MSSGASRKSVTAFWTPPPIPPRYPGITLVLDPLLPCDHHGHSGRFLQAVRTDRYSILGSDARLLKEGNLTYYKPGLLENTWKSCYATLHSDSSLTWYKKKVGNVLVQSTRTLQVSLMPRNLVHASTPKILRGPQFIQFVI